MQLHDVCEGGIREADGISCEPVFFAFLFCGESVPDIAWCQGEVGVRACSGSEGKGA